MDSIDIIEMYEKGYSINFIVRRFQDYLYINHRFDNENGYSYMYCLKYVQNLIIKHLDGKFI